MYSRVFAHFMPQAFPMTFRSMNPFATASRLDLLELGFRHRPARGRFLGLGRFRHVERIARLALAFSNCFAVKPSHAALACWVPPESRGLKPVDLLVKRHHRQPVVEVSLGGVLLFYQPRAERASI